MYRINRKDSAEFSVQHLESEKSATEDEVNNKENTCFLQSFWNQTVPLLRRPLGFNFINCCFLSFGVFFV